jgi:hypothetical protein
MNIHRSVWQLLGVKKNKNGGRYHGNQDAKMLNSLQTSQSFAVMFPVRRRITRTAIAKQ